MIVEWDSEKEKSNRIKHGIGFSLAARVFEDPYRIERCDKSENNVYNEDRFQTIGFVGQVLFVVYTERKMSIRIISARKAYANERRLYHGNSKKNSDDWRNVFFDT